MPYARLQRLYPCLILIFRVGLQNMTLGGRDDLEAEPAIGIGNWSNSAKFQIVFHDCREFFARSFPVIKLVAVGKWENGKI